MQAMDFSRQSSGANYKTLDIWLEVTVDQV
jgi:hypothetical protein